MTRLFPRSSHSNLRVFFACLLSFMTLIAPIASVAAATRNDSRASSRANADARSQRAADDKLDSFLFTNPPAAPLATPDITASKAATFTDSDSDGKAELGETITYNVNVANNGPGNATNVAFADTIDPNTTLVPGSLKVSPLAFADSYVTTTNTVLNVGAPGVLSNDTGTPAPTVSKLNGVATLTGSTTGGGTVTIFADGHFNYTPANNFQGADTFTYTVTNGQAPDDTATVTINVDSPPSVTATTPVNGASNAGTNTAITITFSESVSATASAFTIECPTGTPVTFTQSASPATTFTLTPTSPLPSGVTCTVKVIANQISDTDTFDPPDNMTGDYTFSFSTDAAPTVTTTTPTNGAPSVAANTNITVNFSEPVTANATAFTIECPAGTGKTFTVSGSGTSSIVLDPTADLPFGTLCTVTVIGANIHDTDTNDPPDTMVGNTAFSFTIDSQPTVLSTTPTNGAANAAANTNITVTFSESVNVTASAFTIQCPVGSPVTYTLSPAAPGGTNVFTLDPTTDLPSGVTCTVTVVANQVTDTDTADPPDTMAANYVFTFSVDAAPSVTSTTPIDTATQQANNTDIVINFSENVNVSSTDWFQIVCTSSGTRNPSDTVVTGGPATYTINPNTDFTNGETCTVTVFANKVTDVDANDPPDNMAANKVFSFTIDNPPAVTTTTPANNATNVAVGTNIDITFNEPVDATTSSFTIQCPTGSGNQAYALSNNVGKTVYTLNPTANLPAGAICTVTVVALQISDTDAGDPPDHMLADYVFTFKIPPVANNDTYPQTVIGNVNINSANIPYSVTSNDSFASADPVTINKVQAVTTVVGNTITVTTTKGGTVVMTVSGADVGKFSYNPPAGFEGSDTFTYEITNGGGTSSPAATVTIPVAGMVWFINNNAPSCTTIAAGCGRLTNPYSDLGSFNSQNGTADVPASNLYFPAANDNIFIYQSATAYNNSVTLLTGQKLIGQDSTSSLATITGLNPPSGSAGFPTMFPADGTITKITTGSGNGITLNGTGATGSNVINGLTVGNTAGAGIFGLSFGTLTVADVSIFEPSSTRTGQALFLSGGAVTATFGNVTSSTSATNNVTLTSITGTINLGTGALSGSTGNAFNVSGAGSTATISYAGTITNSAARAVNIINKTGGTVSFSGKITSTNSGIFLDTNTGATINFTGAMDLNTGANTAFTATGGGTVSATQNNTSILNVITATTGSGLNVQNTTIGAAGLTFRSITSNGSGANTGIILSVTGSSGGLTVTGNGGTCTSAATCTGGTIANKTGADGATTNGIGIYLNDTQSPSFSLMQLNDFQNYAILGATVRGFTLSDSIISGTNGTNENIDEDSVRFTQLTGVALVKNTTIGGQREDGFVVINTSGTLNRITFDNDTFNLATSAVADQNLFLQAQSTAVINATIKDSDFNGARGDQFQFDLAATPSGNPTGDLIMTNNNFINGSGATLGGGGVTLSGGGLNPSNVTMTYVVDGNTFRGANGDEILVALQVGEGTFTGKIINNIFGLAGTDKSGSSAASDIEVRTAGGGTQFVTIDNNTLRQYSNFGILLQAGANGSGGSGAFNATVTDNIVSNPSTFGFIKNGIQLNAGTNAGDTHQFCVDIQNNTTGGSGDNGGPDIQVRQRFSTTVRLPGYLGANNDNAAVKAYLEGRNTGAEVALASNTVSTTGGGFINGTAGCGTPIAALDLRSSQREQLASTKQKATKTSAQNEAAHASSSSSDEVFTNHGNVAVKQATQKDAQPIALRSKTSEIVKTAKAQPMAQPLNRRVDSQVFTGHASSSNVKAQPATRNSLLSAALPAPSGETVNATIGTLPAGKSVTVSFQVTVNTAASFTGTSPQVSNQGTVTADNPNGGTLTILTDDTAVAGANNPTVTPVDSQPDLQITKTDGAVVAVPGGTISYTLAYNNTNGKRDANNTVITETIPANTVFNAGASDPSWSCPGGITAGNTCTLAIGNVAAGDAGSTKTFAVTVVNPLPAGVTAISNTATIADDGGYGVDGNTANNTSTVVTSLNAAINLSIVKSDGNTGSTPGQNITYTLTYANTGNKGATGVVLHETVPANTTFNAGASTAGWSCAANTAGSACTFNVGALAGGGAGGSVAFTVTVDNPVPGGTTQISNTATITDDGTNGADSDTSNNTSTDTTPFDAPPTIGTYSNTTVVFGQSTTVSPTAPPADDKPGFTVGVAAPGFTGGLSVNQTTGVVSITNAGPAAAGAYTVTVTVTDSISQTTTRTFQLTVNKANTTTTVTASPNPADIGQQVTFTATVAAVAPGAGTPTGTVDFLDGATIICDDAALNGSGQATCQISSLTAGAHTITANYNGSSNFNTSTGSLPTQTVNEVNISGRKYTDTNGDGDDESGADPGLNGVVIELYNDVNSNGTYEAGTDTLAASTTTANVGGVDGKYSFNNKVPGRYIVREVLQAGYQQTAPAAVNPSTEGIYAINGSGAGGNFTAKDFGNFQLITISGRKFDDLNGNGSDEGGSDPGLNGVTIELYNDVNGNGTLELSGGTPDTLKTSTTTANVAGADGKYSFTNVGPGKYIVREIVPAGYTQTAPASPGTYAITAASGVNVTGRDFGNFRLTTTTTITSSLNPSFFTDPVTFTATVSANPPGSGTPTGTVDFFDGVTLICDNAPLSSGQAVCLISTLAAGSHTITAVYSGDSSFATSNGALPVPQVVNPKADLSVTNDDSPDPVSIGQNLTYTITVTNNGPSDAQSVQLTESVPTNTTFVSFTAPAGWTPSTPGVGGTGAVTATRPTLAASATAVFTLVVKVDLSTPHNTVLSNTASVSTTTTDLVSGNNSDTETTTVNSLIISGRKYTDTNGDGDDESGADPGLNGVVIELYNDVNSNGTYEAGTDTLAASTTTANVGGVDGKYSFSGITPGRYIVREVLPTGYTQTAPAAPGIYAINGTGGGAFTAKDFGNFQLITISGRKFDDLNGNGNDNSGSDPGLNGFTIELYNDVNGNGTLELSGGTPDTLKATQVTANVAGVDGKYSFTNIGPGKYIVREIVPAGYLQTAPAAPGTYAVTAASGVNVTGRDFGNFHKSTTTTVTSSLNPSFFTDSVTFTATVTANAPASGTPTGTVTFFDGVNPICSNVALNGSGQATCTTAALAAGSHTISVQYSGDVNFTSSTGTLPVPQVVNAKADLAVTKVDTPDPVVVGNNITYTITFTNNGPSAANSVTVTDAVPTNTTFVSAAISTGTGWSISSQPVSGGTGNVVFSKATVPSGDTATFQVVVNVNAGVADLAVITNNAVAASTTTDLVSGNNTGTTTTTVRRPGILQFSAATYTANENAGTASIDVTRTSGSGGTVTVHYTITNGTASSADYTGATSGTLTFNNGDTTKTISIPIVNDSLDEVNETLNLALDTPTGGAVLGAQTTAVLTITDDDPTPSLSINDVTVTEGNSGTVDATFTVTLSAASGQTVTVNYATADGTATTADGDYLAIPSTTLTFNPGDTTKTITVKVNGDLFFEGNEDFFVNLSGQTNSTISDAQGRGVITNDDAAPTLSISDATITEGNSGTTNAAFTVTLTGATHNTTTVSYATADGTATAPSDYTAIPSTVLTFLPGETTKTINVVVKGDTNAEADETFFVNLSGATNATITDAQGLGTIVSDDTPLVGLSASTYTVAEDGLHATITVNRLGDLSQPARVDYLTSDPSGLNLCSQVTGMASSRCDYATTAGTLRFAAGETSKTIYIPIVDDVYIDGNETFTLTLSNAVGGDLAGISTATITITDNDTVPAPNPIDNDAFFIRQLYIDFLGREPEPGAVNAWLGILNHCAIPTDCDRIAVAHGFVRSAEFQDRGFFVYRAYKTLGRIAHYNEFIPDMARVSGFLSAQDLEANKAAYILMFMDRQEFKNLYDSTLNNPTAYVDKLLQSVQLPNHPGRAGWIAGLTNNTLTRAQVLRQLIDSGELYTAYVNEAFVIMNYFGFLRRDADASYLVWIDIFNHTNDDRLIISGFLNSLEYRLRFGPN